MLSYKAGIPTGKKCEKMRPGRTSGANQPPWLLPRLLAISRCDFIQDLSPNFPKKPAANPKPNIVTIAVRKWPSSAARFGTFLACTGYPDCKTTRRLVQGTRIAHQPDEPWTKSARFATTVS